MMAEWVADAGRVLCFEVPGTPEPWSTNRAGSWRRNMRLHEGWALAAGWGWRALPAGVRGLWKGRPARVTVAIPFGRHRRRDPHNYVGTVVKAVVDGLVRVRVWPDDTPEWVEVVEPTLAVRGGTCRVTLEAR
jgi:hypothetical protein